MLCSKIRSNLSACQYLLSYKTIYICRLQVPVFFVITKVDIAPEHILKQTVQNLMSILKKPGVKKKPFLVRNMDDVLLCARNMNTDSLAPIFLTSAVTGENCEMQLFISLA